MKKAQTITGVALFLTASTIVSPTINSSFNHLFNVKEIAQKINTSKLINEEVQRKRDLAELKEKLPNGCVMRAYSYIVE